MEKLSFLIALSVLTVLFCYKSTTFANVDEESLLAFKSRITSDPFDILARNWSTMNGASFCFWVGVSCGANQRITTLDLHGWNLEGTIAPHLGNLTFLRSLDLGSNRFTGRVSEELSGLRRLQVLKLGANNLTGTIPMFLGALTELEQISMNNNSFTGVIPRLSNLSKLEIFDMTRNYLYGTLPQAIGNLSSLRVLSTRSNHMTGSIPYELFNISSLQVIDLTNNSFTGTIPMNFCDNLSRLNILELSWNNFSGAIPPNIYQCKSMKILSLSANEFSGSIPKQIGELTMLKELYIGGNNLEGSIPVGIGNLSQIEILNTFNNSISGEIPSVLFNLSSLIRLDLSFNDLSGSLPLDIQLPNLDQLALRSNHLRGQIIPILLHCRKLSNLDLHDNEFTSAVPEQVGNLTQLKILNLGHNKMTGEIPSELGNLKLEGIYLGKNGFSGSIPVSIFNISTLTVLELFDNHFTGQLPQNIGTSLPNLQVLSLDSNNLTGMIPNTLNNASKLSIISFVNNSFTGVVPNFGNLRGLRFLYLGKNNLIGGSPNQELRFISSLSDCPLLEDLDLSSNQLNGILPASLGTLSKSLCFFSAFDCQIKGSIPPTIGNLTGLKSVDLHSNELTGLIPETVGKLTRMDRLYLQQNRLEGNMPTELCQLNRLRDLYLSENMLNGTIPSCFGELKFLSRVFLDSNRLTSVVPNLWNIAGLSELNLSTNFLSGNISSEIPNSKLLWNLDLSWNLFSGDIPINIGDFHSLENLSFAHNNLQGSIPQSLGDLRGMLSLDLSHNNITGYIPKSLESLMFLSYLDLSYNKLEGEIPKGGPFSKFTDQSYAMNYALCGDVRLHVPACQLEGVYKSRSKHVSPIKYILAPTLLAILAVSLSIWLLQRRKANKKQTQVEIPSIHSWRRISYLELRRATEDFSEVSIIGIGSFGSVYRGTLSDGLNIAVKVFNVQLERAIKSFEVECEVMSTIRHKNLVRVISCCSNIDFKALVLEYISNGSLENWLYSTNNFLDLLQRLNISIDIALALEYLHHGITSPIIHCDLKPSNILIDKDMIAHVGDFGIAKIFEEGETFYQTITLATIGYMAPEYGSEGKVSTSCDIYSYGITLLELFTSKKPTDDKFTEEMSLKDWVSEALQENIVTEIAAAGLLDQEDRHFLAKELCVSSVFDLAMKCLAISPQERINMIETVVILTKIKSSFLASTGVETTQYMQK
ncbi:uncharacterized protein [Primulina eburnea]|uniref:uncharacterized protein n=1 Tax=Primulina eburnea TaxID=1245227 RepID=UPI003C6C6884